MGEELKSLRFKVLEDKPQHKLTYDHAGLFLMGDIKGDLDIKSSDVRIIGSNIDGNVTISGGIKKGNIELRQVTSNGILSVESGQCIELRDSKFSKLALNNEKDKVTIIGEKSSVREIELGSRNGVSICEALITFAKNSEDSPKSNKNELIVEDGFSKLVGDFETVTSKASNVKLNVVSGSVKNLSLKSKTELIVDSEVSIERLQVNKGADLSKIEIRDKAEVKKLNVDAPTILEGKGKIKEANVSVAGTSIEKSLILSTSVSEGISSKDKGDIVVYITDKKETKPSEGERPIRDKKPTHEESENDRKFKNIVRIEPLIQMNTTTGSAITLPSQVNVILDDNSRKNVDIVWDSESIDYNTPGTYVITGRLVLSEIVHNPRNIQPTLTINVGVPATSSKSIISVEDVADINVDKGTDLSVVGLPDSVDITLSDNSVVQAEVQWNNGEPPYDSNVERTYTFKGRIIVPHGVTNPNNLVARAKVKVKSDAVIDAVAPTINTEPSDETVNINEIVSLSITATTSKGTLTYQWYSNSRNSNRGGRLISGAASETYEPPTTSEGETYYYCVVTNTDNSATGNKIATITSNVAKVKVEAALKTIVSVKDVSIEVVKGTESNALGLPTKVEVTLSDTNKVEADVIWDGGNPAYNKDQTGSYEFRGTITLPTGVTNPSNLKAKATVVVKEAQKTIKSVKTVSLTVDNGTELSSVGLPTEVELILDDNSKVNVAVVWDGGTPAYDKTKAGSYEFSGTITLPSGVTNPNNLKAKAIVVVKEAPKTIVSIKDINIEVVKGTESNALGLPTKVEVTLSDTNKVEADVIWDGGNPAYNKDQTGSYEFRGTITLPTGVTNPSNLKAKATVVVKEAQKTIKSVKTVSLTVDNGTELSSVGLPTEVELILDDNSKVNVAVVWDGGTPAYDKTKAGSYEFSGTITLPSGVTNPNNLKAKAIVVVKEAPKTIVSMKDVNIEVVKGTESTALGLPTKVEVTLSDTNKVEADVIWDGGNPAYNKDQTGSYEFRGTITLPPGVTNPSNLKAKATVAVKEAQKTIKSVKTVSLTVDNGTELSSVGLPTEVELTLDDNSKVNVAVVWDGGTPAYDKTKAGSYAFSGTITLPTGVTNPIDTKATATVAVKEIKYGTLYSMDNTDPSGGVIYKSDMETGAARVKIISSNEIIREIFLDRVSKRLYFRTMTTIRSCNLDGSGEITHIFDLPDSQSGAMTVYDNNIYFSINQRRSIYRVPVSQLNKALGNLGGNEILYGDKVSDYPDVSGEGITCLKVSGGKLYWSDGGNGAQSAIRYVDLANMSLGNIKKIYVDSNMPWITSFDIDETNQKIYWASITSTPSIKVANISSNGDLTGIVDISELSGKNILSVKAFNGRLYLMTYSEETGTRVIECLAYDIASKKVKRTVGISVGEAETSDYEIGIE